MQNRGRFDGDWREFMQASPKTKDARHRRLASQPVVSRSYDPPASIPTTVADELRRLHSTIRQLEKKQDAQAAILAEIQRAGSLEHSAELFRQALAAAVVNAAPSALTKDGFGAAAQFVPVAQNLKGGLASFATKPISTLAAPAIALGIFALRQPRAPIIVTNRLTTGSHPVRVTVISPDGGDIHYTLDGSDVTKSSPRYYDHIEVRRHFDGPLRVRAFLLLRASEITEVRFTTWLPTWIQRFTKLFG